MKGDWLSFIYFPNLRNGTSVKTICVNTSYWICLSPVNPAGQGTWAYRRFWG